jgi:hypothetical protein
MKPWIVPVARFGYLSYGIVYFAMGALAIRAAAGKGPVKGTEGTIQHILFQPFGKILLFLIAFGLIAYVFWRFVQAIKNPEREGITDRIGNFSSGIVYAGISLFAFKLLRGVSGNPDANQEQRWSAKLISQPAGEWLLTLGGFMILGSAFYQFYEAFTARFRKKLRMEEMSGSEGEWVIRAGRLGAFARGILFLTIGYQMIQAGWKSNPSETAGVDEALRILAGQPDWIFYLVAAGVAAFGIFALFMARYRRILHT